MIYTVKSGDTLYSIANKYKTTIEKIVKDNGLTRPNELAIGQNLWISSPDQSQTYTVVNGDTLYKISTRFGIPLNTLINANKQIENPNYIQVGQTINIPSTKRSIEVNGYAIANISQSTLTKTLPYLTYLSIFSYQARPNGSLSNLYERTLIDSALSSNASPVMVVSNIGEDGGFDSDLASTILNNQEIQNNLINNIISIVNDKKYNGVDLDFEYIYPKDREAYNTFLRNLKNRLTPINIPLSVAVAPKYRDNQQGLLYEAHDYKSIGEIADRVIIMTYEWGYLYGEPMAISPLREVESVISYAVTRIPSNKILMGMPNYSYDWKIPYTEGSAATTITNSRALDIALDNGATIYFDSSSQTPYFNYTNADGENRVVWFDDARSIEAKLSLVSKYNLAGVSYWTINNFHPVNWTVLSNMYDIVKILP